MGLFIVTGLFGLLFFIASLLFGDHDVSHDVHDVDGDHDHGGPSVISVFNVAWFLIGFGGAGALLKASGAGMPASTVSGVVDRLEQKGYVERTRDATDRRVVKISLTKAGKRVVQSAPEAAQGKLLHGLESLSRQEVKGIHASLDKVVRLMEIQDVKATFFFSEE